MNIKIPITVHQLLNTKSKVKPKRFLSGAGVWCMLGICIQLSSTPPILTLDILMMHAYVYAVG